jgi:hypothetical protein
MIPASSTMAFAEKSRHRNGPELKNVLSPEVLPQ